MSDLNRGGAVLKVVSTTALLHLTLHPKFPLNPLSIYSLLLGEGVKGKNRESKSLKKDVLDIFSKFGKFIFHPLPAPAPCTPLDLTHQNAVSGYATRPN